MNPSDAVLEVRTLVIGVLAAAAMLVGANQAAAADREQAKPGRYPGGLPCVTNGSGAIACYQDADDKIWVKDDAHDGFSAVAVWEFPLEKREGVCRNALGYGRWGVCNKSFGEDASFYFWAAEYNAETGSWMDWSRGRDAAS